MLGIIIKYVMWTVDMRVKYEVGNLNKTMKVQRILKEMLALRNECSVLLKES